MGEQDLSRIHLGDEPLDIARDNIFELTTEIPPIGDAAGTTVMGPKVYGSVMAGRRYAREHPTEIYHGQDTSLAVFNTGHSIFLYNAGLIDETNIVKVVDKKTGEEDIYSVVPVGQLLEMAIWMVHNNEPIPRIPTPAKTWFGFIADLLTGEVGQGTLKNKVDVIKRLSRHESLNRRLQDRRRTEKSVMNEVLRTFHSQRARNKILIPAAQAFVTQLKTLHQQMPNVVNYDADSHLIHSLQDKLAIMKEDLHAYPTPFPDDTPLSPTAS